MRPPPASSPDSQGRSPADGPPEESFDEKYNKRLEFPTSLVGTVLVHVAIAAGFVAVISALANTSDTSDVKVTLVNVLGPDDSGAGSPGSGGEDTSLDDTGNFRAGPDAILPIIPVDPIALPEVSERPQEIELPQIAPRPAGQQAVSFPKPGAGPGQGKGKEGTPGAGPGGTGPDSTQARNMRWVLRFKVSSGRDYIDQLKLMGAELLVPYRDPDKAVLVPDLAKETVHRPAAVSSVLKALDLADVPAKSFWAFFPRDLEEELSRKELSYRNRRAEDIEETIFEVVIKDGKCDLRVTEQKAKR